MNIGITTGDVDGVGLEITIKSLKKMKFPKGAQVDVYLGAHQLKLAERALKSKKGLRLLGRTDSPANWVELCIDQCQQKKLDALVTGPLSKQEFIRAGYKDLGHTEMLARCTGIKDLVMSFWGKEFNLALATNHLPLSQVSSELKADRILKVHELCQQALPKLDPKKRGLPNLLLGLNPHAGDQGLIGTEELYWPLQKKLTGPVPADSAFTKMNFKKHGVFIACYHDQGLIPFKMAHGFDAGVHVTLGLPFLRTSVDHGPAKDLFGKNKAAYGSMKAAIEMALRWRK